MVAVHSNLLIFSGHHHWLCSAYFQLKLYLRYLIRQNYFTIIKASKSINWRSLMKSRVLKKRVKYRKKWLDFASPDCDSLLNQFMQIKECNVILHYKVIIQIFKYTFLSHTTVKAKKDFDYVLELEHQK